MKTLISAMFLSLLWVSPVFAQDGNNSRMFLSNSLKPDPTQMVGVEEFKPGDPIYLVLVIDPKDKRTIGDLASTDPTTKERNVFVCIEVFSSIGKTVCPGILKTPLSQSVLDAKSVVYPIIPATNDINVDNGDVVNNVLKSLQGAYGQSHITVTLRNYNTEAVTAGVVKYDVDVSGWSGSRWSKYRGLFLDREANADKEKQSVFDAGTKVVATDWVKNYTSRRVDPALEKDIGKWWKGPDPTKIPDPILRIYFLEPNYEIARNAFGEVLRKTVDALILWKERTGTKCYIQWRSFGYESFGGGTFSPEMQMWTFDRNIPMAGGRKILAGSWYEVDCAPFVK